MGEKRKAVSTALVQQTPKVCRQLKLVTGEFCFQEVLCVCFWLVWIVLLSFIILLSSGVGGCLVWIFVITLRGQKNILVQVPVLEGNLCRHMPSFSYIPPTHSCLQDNRLIIKFCMQTTLLFLNALQTVLTILKLSTDLDMAVSHGPQCNVWHELRESTENIEDGAQKEGQ